MWRRQGPRAQNLPSPPKPTSCGKSASWRANKRWGPSSFSCCLVCVLSVFASQVFLHHKAQKEHQRLYLQGRERHLKEGEAIICKHAFVSPPFFCHARATTLPVPDEDFMKWRSRSAGSAPLTDLGESACERAMHVADVADCFCPAWAIVRRVGNELQTSFVSNFCTDKAHFKADHFYVR